MKVSSFLGFLISSSLSAGLCSVFVLWVCTILFLLFSLGEEEDDDEWVCEAST